MAETKRSGLTARIPEDVLARAKKAGVEDVDWYAGRLEQSDGVHIAAVDGGMIEDRHRETVKRYREDQSRNGGDSTIVRLVAMWARAVRRTPRRVG
jgi:hypothetical protein